LRLNNPFYVQIITIPANKYLVHCPFFSGVIPNLYTRISQSKQFNISKLPREISKKAFLLPLFNILFQQHFSAQVSLLLYVEPAAIFPKTFFEIIRPDRKITNTWFHSS